MPEVEEAVDRVMAGPERKTRVMSEREKRLIAYHEGGHAMVAHVLPNTDEVHKITVIPRGRALGYTLTLPEQDKFLMTREELRDELAMLMGGRVAEEIVAGDITTGARTTSSAPRRSPARWSPSTGCRDAIGPRTLGQKQGEVFLGRDLGIHARLLRRGGVGDRHRGRLPDRRGPRRGARDPDREPREARASSRRC